MARLIVRAACLLLFQFVTLFSFAANRVGDADNSGAIEMSDAALVQSRLYGTAAASAVSPLALADTDSDLDIADLMLVAQAATSARVIDNPALSLTFTPPSPVLTVSGQPAFVESFAIASPLPALAGLVDGLVVSFAIQPASSSTLSLPSSMVSGGLASVSVTPLAPPGGESFDVLLSIPVADSTGGNLRLLTSSASVMVAAPSCGDGVIQAGETCDDGNSNNGDGCQSDCQPGCIVSLIYEESFSDGDDVGWSHIGFQGADLWHVSSADNAPGGTAPSHTAWFVDEGQGNYDYGQWMQVQLRGPQVVLPAPGPGESLTFSYWENYNTELNWDTCWGGVFNASFAVYTANIGSGSSGGWVQRSYDLGAAGLGGATIRPFFEFNTANGLNNNYPGWKVDEIRIELCRSCGNGFVDPGEACDDGANGDPCDGCTDGCQLTSSSCGNGTIECAESCDDGDLNECTTGCNASCSGPGAGSVCGNGAVECAEVCDLGPANGTGEGICASDCSGPQTCGDGIVHGTETCDDGDLDECTTGCNAACSGPGAGSVCGNGTVECIEVCDQGAANGTGEGTCVNDCSGLQTCGDGIVHGTEICDDGAANGTGEGLCLPGCASVQTCGNGIIEGTEVCDDGNLVAGDGCEPTCFTPCVPYAIFEDDFTDGNDSGWTHNVPVGPDHWHVSPNENAPGGTLPANALWFVNEALGAYDTWTTHTAVITSPSVALPTLKPGESLLLSYWQKYDVEGPWVDTCTSRVRTGPVSSETIEVVTGYADWARRDYDLTHLAEGSVQIEYRLYNYYSLNNFYTGWRIDEVKVEHCRLCGNGILDPGETCDEGAANGTGDGHCLGDCSAILLCGDGVITGPEICDDGSFNGTGNGYCLGDCSAMQICGDGILNGMETCEGGNVPSLVGNYGTAELVQDISIQGNRAYLAVGASGMQVVDISTDTPAYVGGYPVYADGVYAIGNRAYVVDGNNYVMALDISTPSPTELGRYWKWYGTDVFADATRAYASFSVDGLLVFDVTAPAPVLLGSYNTPGSARDVYVKDNRAYVADGYSGLQVLDVTGSTPVYIGSYDTPGYAWGVFVEGNLAYMADDQAGLLIFDVSAPIPAYVGGYDTPGNAMSVQVEGARAYIADNNYGFHIIDVSQPTPAYVGGHSQPGTVAFKVAVSAHRAYVGTQNGLLVYDITEPCGPQCAAPVCGDGALNPGEICDDGDTSNCTVACNATCSGPATGNICGDGIVECAEVCDQGVSNGAGDGLCLSDCSAVQTCGDGVVNGTEDCDDGANGDPCDGCTDACGLTASLCGNGTLDCAEICDDGNGIETDGCGSNCQPTCQSATYFLDDFSDGNDAGWSHHVFAGLDLWHVSPGDNAPGGNAPDNVLWFANPGQADYSSAPNAIVQLRNAGIALPSILPGEIIAYSFWEKYSTESGADLCISGVFDPSFANYPVNTGSGDSGGWVSRYLDISSLAGQTVRPYFEFQSNGVNNAFSGWKVDEVRIDVCRWCGNGHLDGAEPCDDGAANGTGDGLCLEDCSAVQTCGDGITNGTELCDEGASNGTGEGFCISDCTSTQICGDGIANGTEPCDDGANNGLGEGFCLPDCSGIQTCGDGAANGTESCDDGNVSGGDGCRGDCLGLEVCGDGLLDVGELCDDGANGDACDGCTDGCLSTGLLCGNGILECAEACDDGNAVGQDGCSANCTSDCVTSVLFEDDFSDGNDNGWFHLTSFGVDLWHVSPNDNAPGGTPPDNILWYVDEAQGNYDYGVMTTVDLRHGWIGLPAMQAGESIKYSYWENYQLEPGADFCIGMFSGSVTGATYVNFGTGDSGGWNHRVLDITAQGGQSIQPVFQFQSNATSNNYPGCKIDEFRIEMCRWCGNGLVDAGESCDNGAANGTCGNCNATCSAPFNTCGDGVTLCGESCDDGAAQGEGLCLNDCSGLQICGDMAVQGTEACEGPPLSVNVRGNTPSSGSAIGIDVVGNWVYAADAAAGLRIINVSDPDNPVVVGTYDTPGSAWDVEYAGGYAFVADSLGGLAILDVSTPSLPVLAGSLPTSQANGLDVRAGIAYVADIGMGLRIIDVGTPATPVLLGTWDTPGLARGVDVEGTIAYVADDSGGLRIIDVSNPAAPIELGSLLLADTAMDVVYHNGHAYVAAWGAGLRAVDVSNPALPVEAGFVDTPGLALSLAIAGDLAYVADYTGGLRVVDISNPAMPVELAYATPPGAGYYGVATAGRYAYMANDALGLQILEASSTCLPGCSATYCGDGLPSSGEQCEGSADNHPCEPATCTYETCGNWSLDAGESCDQGSDNGAGPGWCNSDCSGWVP